MNLELAQFQQWLRLRGRSEATVKTYTYILSRYYALHQDTMAFLSSSSLLSASTRNSYKNAIKTLYRFRGEQPDVVQDLLTSTRPQSQAYQLIPMEKVNDIIAATRPHWNSKDYLAWRSHIIVELLAYSGIRPKELVGIRYRDITPDKIWINGIKREDGRSVYPPLRVFQDIDRLMRIGTCFLEHEPVFKMESCYIMEIVKELTGYRPKDFRTTFGTEVARVTKDPYMVQQLIGHRQISSSAPYIHLGAEYARKIKEVELYGK